MFYTNILQTEKMKFYKIVLILAGVLILMNISSSRSMQNGNDDDVVAGAGRLTARAAFYTAMTTGGEWIGEELALRTLGRVGNNTMLGTWFKGWNFLKNMDNVEKLGKYAGTAVGFVAADIFCTRGIPAINIAAGCINRTIESIWEWDPRRSSTRDKIVTGVCAGFITVSFCKHKQILNDVAAILFGRKK